MQIGNALSRGYDFSNMSRMDMRKAMNDLIQKGDMTVDDSAGLIGIIGPSQTSYAGTGSPAGDWDTRSVNAFSMLQSGIAGANSRHDTQTAEEFMHTLQVLEQLQGTAG